MVKYGMNTDEEIAKNMKTLRDLAIKREFEGDGPNKLWYMGEYADLALEKNSLFIIPVVLMAGVLACLYPENVIPFITTTAMVVGIMFGVGVALLAAGVAAAYVLALIWVAFLRVIALMVGVLRGLFRLLFSAFH